MLQVYNVKFYIQKTSPDQFLNVFGKSKGCIAALNVGSWMLR